MQRRIVDNPRLSFPGTIPRSRSRKLVFEDPEVVMNFPTLLEEVVRVAGWASACERLSEMDSVATGHRQGCRN